MKQVILTSFLCLFIISIKAQVKNIVIEYRFVITTPQGASTTFFKTLKDDGKTSLFTTKDTTPDGSTDIVVGIDKKKDRGIFINKTTNKLYQYYPILQKDFYIQEDSILNQFKWTIIDTIQKNILGYSSKLATCDFRGRHYEVYFSESLPYYTGPWKLTGLPGTILEARTKDGLYQFYASKIMLNIGFETIENPYNSSKISFLSFKDHKQLLKKKLHDLQMKAQSEEKEKDVTYNIEDNSIELLK